MAAEDVREAVLQTYLFAGFPRAINGLWTLDELCRGGPGRGAPEKGKKRFLSASLADLAARSRRAAGEKLCRKIYGPDYAPMMGRMRRLSPDLAAWILEEGYGKVLSRPRLTPRERELLVLPTLAAMGAWRQLGPHLRGALRVGATREEIRGVARAAGDLLDRRALRALEGSPVAGAGPKDGRFSPSPPSS